MPEDAILLDIVLRALPPSINSMYETTRNGRRVKSDAACAFTELAVGCIQLENRGFTIPVDTDLEFFLVCYYPDLKVKRKKDPLYINDSDNRLKAAKDSVFTASLLDTTTMRRANDSQVFMDIAVKKRGSSECLQKYPSGYCRVILSKRGHSSEILEMLERDV